MVFETLRLDTFPVEIIRRIVAYGPCESALALLKVNRALYQVCNDRLVFKSIIENGNGPPREMPIWQCTALSLQSPITLWARYALADSKAACLPDYFLWDVGCIYDEFAQKEAPQLMALHHPLIDYVSVNSLIECLTNILDNDHHATQAWSFCLATRIMTDKFPETHQHLVDRRVRSFDYIRSAFQEELWFTLKQFLYDLDDLSLRSTLRPEIVALKHTTANKAVGIFSFELRYALSTNRVYNLSIPIANTPPASRILLKPPTTLNIPFHSFMDLPLPFSPNANEAFATCHLRTMTSTEFLQDGEWAGYYCFNGLRNQENVHFDPPMTGIRFVACEHDTEPKRLFLVAAGIDSVGSFHLQGDIDSETGKVMIMKQYSNGDHWSWAWHCLMTPFGIVGSWGSREWGGWLWLWKTDWLGADRGSLPLPMEV